MGYYTSYYLDIDALDNVAIPQCEHENPDDATFCIKCGKQIKNKDVVDLVWEYIEDEPTMASLKNAVGSWGDGGEGCKWYEHKRDMKLLSEKFSGTLFTLSGEGEEPEDLWVQYWFDGRYQFAGAKITYDPFDPEKLKEYEEKR